MSKEKEFFVAIPGFVVEGEPMEDSVLDGIVETLEVNPSDVQVIESNGKFYVFLKNQMDFETVREKIQEGTQLNQTYKSCVSAVTRSVRRVDKYQNDYAELHRDIQKLKEESSDLLRVLKGEETARQEQNKLARAVEEDFQTLMGFT